jgi:CubicO group peptidase (beta-lactamase class C family)
MQWFGRLAVWLCATAMSLELPASAASGSVSVERGLDPSELMRRHHVPGMSVAVIENFKIVWTKGYGVTELDGTVPVTPQTLFLAGSISKPVTAAAALRLVEQGKLSLNEDVNLRLKTWRVPKNPFTPRHPVTLALLLDHTGGFTGGDFFPGYAIDSPRPSLREILDGSGVANNPPVRVGFEPGSRWNYSGDGYLVVQQLLMDVSGLRFPELMRKELFDRVGMRDSTFEQPLPSALTSSAASGTLRNGKAVAGRWHVQPEMAAGGLWTTPSDLARLAIDLALALGRKENHLLSPQMTRAMLSAHHRDGVINILGTKGDPDAMGYGFFVGRGHRFGHIGGNVGYQATMIMFGDAGRGAVIMTNSDIGLQVGNTLLEAIARENGWDYAPPPPP